MLYACGTNIDNGSEYLSSECEKTESLPEVYYEVKNYKDSLLAISPQTRGFGRFAAVVAADVLSVKPAYSACTGTAAFILAVTGGTATPGVAVGVLAATGFLAAGASCGTYLGTKNIIYSDGWDNYLETYASEQYMSDSLNIYYNSLISLEGPSLTRNDNLADSIPPIKRKSSILGKIHNLYLSNALNAYVESGDSLCYNQNTTPLLSPIYNELTQCQINSYGVALFSDADIINMADSINTQYDDFMTYINDEDYDSILEDYYEDGIITFNTKNILSLFFQAFSTKAFQADVNHSIDQFERLIIPATSLEDSEIQDIIFSVEMARYSWSFWLDYYGI